jgi:dynein heavy chain
VASLSAELKTMQDQFDKANAEQQDLKEKADTMDRRLAAASRLIAGLQSERERWTSETKV